MCSLKHLRVTADHRPKVSPFGSANNTCHTDLDLVPFTILSLFGLCRQCCCVAQHTEIPGHTEAPLVPASTCLNLLKIGLQEALVNAPNPIATYGVTKPVKTGGTGCFPQSLLVDPAGQKPNTLNPDLVK